jgi:hypothetical protein
VETISTINPFCVLLKMLYGSAAVDAGSGNGGVVVGPWTEERSFCSSVLDILIGIIWGVIFNDTFNEKPSIKIYSIWSYEAKRTSGLRLGIRR